MAKMNKKIIVIIELFLIHIIILYVKDVLNIQKNYIKKKQVAHSQKQDLFVEKKIHIKRQIVQYTGPIVECIVVRLPKMKMI